MATPEGIIKNQICNMLMRQPDLEYWMSSSQGTYDPGRGVFRKMASPHQKRGVGDITICLQVLGVGCFVSLEVKAPKGRQSDHQRIFEANIKQKSGAYFIVRSVEDALMALHDARVSFREKILLAKC